RQPHRKSRVTLALRQRLDPRANLFRNSSRGEKADREDNEHEARYRAQPEEDRRDDVVPEEDLDEQRDVAEELGPSVADEDEPPARGRAQNAEQRAHDEGDDQRQNGERQRPAPGTHEPMEVRLAASRVLQEELPIRQSALPRPPRRRCTQTKTRPGWLRAALAAL